MAFCLVSQTQGSRTTPEDCNFQMKLWDKADAPPPPAGFLKQWWVWRLHEPVNPAPVSQRLGNAGRGAGPFGAWRINH